MADNGWTLDTLKTHFDDLRKADQEAIKILANNFEKRMDNTNEWRGVIERLLTTYVTKGAAYSAMATVIAVLGVLIAYYATFGSTP